MTFFNSAGVPTKSIITTRSPYVVTESANGKTLLGVSPFVTKMAAMLRRRVHG